MNFDPTFNYGYSDLSIDKNLVYRKFRELITTLITLTSRAERQREIIGMGEAANEMALDFETYFTLSFQSYIDNNLLTTEQKDILFDLDKFFNERSGDNYPDFWNDEELATNPEWKLVRQKAKSVLQLLHMDNLSIEFDREEEYKTFNNTKRLVGQITRTRLIKQNS